MSLGTHVLCDFYGCDSVRIKDNTKIKEIIEQAINDSGAQIVETKLYHFEPFGLTGIIIITESHFSIHTWPEHGYIAIDYFTCSKKIDINKAIEILKEYFQPTDTKIKEIHRGDV